MNAIILFIAFTVRYNALIYPFISIGTFLISPMLLWKKTIGIATFAILCGSFVLITADSYKKLTGKWQFSPFSGWQYANNAMYAYRYVNENKRKPVPDKFQKLDVMIRQYFDSTRDIAKYPSEKFEASTYYMWTRSMPLMKYRDSLFKHDTTSSELQKWATMGPFYKQYGIFIIKSYPSAFISHFLWPNTTKFFAPPLEYLQAYNQGKDSVHASAKGWFGYKTHFVTTRAPSKSIKLLLYYPILGGIANLLILFNLVLFLSGSLSSAKKNQKRIIALFFMFWGSNAAFTICASSAALRFQAFPVICTCTFCIIATELSIRHYNECNKVKELIPEPLKEGQNAKSKIIT